MSENGLRGHAPRRLPAYLAASYALLTVYACLHPFSGWRDTGIHPLEFVTAPWPRYILLSDIWLNVLGYVPFGFTLAAALRGALRLWVVLLVVLLAATGLSFGLEFVQNYLPTRVAANTDLAANVLGGLLGGILGLHWGRIFDAGGVIDQWRERHVQPGHVGEIGMVLVALWWLTQLEPSSTLFGIGDLRPLFDLPAPMDFSARRFIAVETVIVACNLLALGLLVMHCLRSWRLTTAVLVVLVGLLLRTLADAVFIVPSEPFEWITPGARRGLALGSVALLIAWRLPRGARHSLACMALLVATAMVNLAPENPFQLASMRLMQRGHFLNFNGLTRLTSSLWPFLSLAYLTAQGALRPASRRVRKE